MHVEALSESKKWRAVALIILAATMAFVFTKPPKQVQLIALSFGFLAAMAAVCAANLFNHMSEFAKPRPSARLLFIPVLFAALILQSLDRLVQAGTLTQQMEIVWSSGFLLTGLVMVVAAMRIEKILKSSKMEATAIGK